jgi:hypothetical protein
MIVPGSLFRCGFVIELTPYIRIVVASLVNQEIEGQREVMQCKILDRYRYINIVDISIRRLRVNSLKPTDQATTSACFKQNGFSYYLMAITFSTNQQHYADFHARL